MTGYSTKENVNNINVPHLHFGMQLIFDESQKEGVNQIWIDVYQIINFLKKNKSEVYRTYEDTKDYERKYNKQVTYRENVIDSLTKENNALRDTLKDIRHINESLGNEITIYKEQNSNLSDAAKRQVIVRVNKK